jgi:hypothetical protein
MKDNANIVNIPHFEKLTTGTRLSEYKPSAWYYRKAMRSARRRHDVHELFELGLIAVTALERSLESGNESKTGQAPVILYEEIEDRGLDAAPLSGSCHGIEVAIFNRS